VHVRGWRWGYRDLLPAPFLEGLSIARRTAQWRSWLLDPGRTHTWVAETDALAPAGFVAAGPTRDPGEPPGTGEIYALYVEEAVAGAGVGAALLDRATEWLGAQGFSRATLWVLRGNSRARRFYEKAGWRPDGAEQSEQLDDAVMDEVRYAITTSSGPT
jgi:GNAT superfamily N-acetyltransferase